MIVRAFRIVQSHLVANALDGEGARRYGGRWNLPGVPCVYAASSISLATLELLVHARDVSLLFERYSVVPLEFDHRLIHDLDRRVLPANWPTPEIDPATQVVGSDWLRSKSSLVLRVPSAVTAGEDNFLINPLHSGIGKLAVKAAQPLGLDRRLRK